MALFYFARNYGPSCPDRRALPCRGRQRRLSLREQLFCGVAAGADAVGDADPAIGVPSESEAGQLLAQAFDALEAIEMSDTVLRHGGLPFVHTSEKRLGAQAENLLQFVADDAYDLLVGERPDVFRIPSSKETPEQRPILGSAMRKFVVNKSCSQQLLAFAAGNKESEPWRERFANIAVISETDGNGRAVLDGGEFGRKVGASHPKHLSGRRCRQRNDDAVEVIGLHAG